MNKSKVFFTTVLFIYFLFSFSFAECKHDYKFVEEDSLGKHHRECTLCGYKENSSHTVENEWSFDDEGKYHFYKCKVSSCSYEYKKGEHMGGNHENYGECSVCNGIYQTHAYDVENIKSDSKNHWYVCSYIGCEYAYEKEPHEESIIVSGDLTYHWYRCALLDCSYKFNSEKHYGGNDNSGYCAFGLCQKLYMAKLQIDEYEYREYNVGDKDKLVASIIPEGIEVPEAEYIWSSTIPSVVKIDKNGNIEALKEGISIVTCLYGDLSASCVVVVGELEVEVKPLEHNLYVNEVGTSTIDVTYKKDKKKININEFVDFNGFRWKREGLKADIKEKVGNEISFLAKNKSEEPTIFYMWLDNRLRNIDERIDKVLKIEEEKIQEEIKEINNLLKKNEEEIDVDSGFIGNNLSVLGEKIEKIKEDLLDRSKDKEIKEKINNLQEKVKDDNKYSKKEILELKKALIELKQSIIEYRVKVEINVNVKEEQPVNSPTTAPTESTSAKQSPNPSVTPSISPSPSSSIKPSSSATTSSKPSSGGVIGPAHTPQGAVSGSGQNVVNRKHVCSAQSYFPNPANPESGHLKRCYYTSCEFYKEGVKGTQAEHQYKHSGKKNVDVCIICYYEKGSNIKEPQIVHSRDFGIDVLQSQFFVVQGLKTEIDVIITGIDEDLKIYYGAVDDSSLRSTEGRDDENSVRLKWDVKDSYAKEAFEFNFEKREDGYFIIVELKDGYVKDVKSEVELILENNFGEKRRETIELLKEAPERAQPIHRWSSDIISAITVGETKEIKVVVKNLYGYGISDSEEVRKYYESKGLTEYEDFEIKWEATGGIALQSFETTPDAEGYVRAQITGVSEGEGTVIAKMSAKYENGDLIEVIEDRPCSRGIKVYPVTTNSSSSGTTLVSSGSNTENNSGGGSSSSSLPIAAGVMGAVAIVTVGIVVNKMTK